MNRGTPPLAGLTPPTAGAPAAAAAPSLSSFAPDAEGNFKLAIRFYISALRTVPASALECAQGRLRGAYSELGEMYTREDRYTKACRHYQQGIELLRTRAPPLIIFHLINCI